jgi:uncharacterized UBP type Zn finger protein
MSSVLQCLVHVAPLTHFIKSKEFDKLVLANKNNDDGSGGELARAFRTFVVQYEESVTFVSPDQLKAATDRFMPDFKVRKQHDAFEFLLQFFDILHEDLKSSTADRSIVSELFHCDIIAHRQFTCRHVDNSDDQPSCLILPLPSGKAPVTFEMCLRDGLKPKALMTLIRYGAQSTAVWKPFKCKFGFAN